jgi:hypothetical protein
MKPEHALEAEILAALRRAPGPEPSAELDARILARSKRSGGGWLRPSRLTAIAATVLVLAGGGVALRLAQQVDTRPAALQIPPSSSAADQPEAAAPASAERGVLAREDDARDASMGPATVTIDAMAKRESNAASAELEAHRSYEAGSARREAIEAPAADIRQRLWDDAAASATPPPPAPAPPPAPSAEPATKTVSEPARMAESFPAAPADTAIKPGPQSGQTEPSTLGAAQATAAAVRLQELEMLDEHKDEADTGAQALVEIRRLLAAGRREEARARLAQLRAEDPEFLVPAELEALLQGDAPD